MNWLYVFQIAQNGYLNSLKSIRIIEFVINSVTDDFTSHLIDIAKEAIKSPFYQPIGLGIMRSDYMIDKSNPSGFLQVQFYNQFHID